MYTYLSSPEGVCSVGDLIVSSPLPPLPSATDLHLFHEFFKYAGYALS